MSHFTEPFQYEFFRHGLIVATLVGALCGMIGVSIILRRMSYIGHGLSHSVFGGAVVSYLIGWNFYLGAGLWGFFSALLINATAKRRNIGGDAAIGIVTTASFALGVALISKTRKFTRNFEAALFGNILGVTREDIYVIAAVTAVVALATFFAYKQLLFATFDPELARVYGVPTHWVDTGFALALAATIVASMNVVGVTLIAAASPIPKSAAPDSSAYDVASVSTPPAPLRRLASSVVTRSSSRAALSSIPSPRSTLSRIPRNIFRSIKKWSGSQTTGPTNANGKRCTVSARSRISNREPLSPAGSTTNAQLQSKYPGSLATGARFVSKSAAARNTSARGGCTTAATNPVFGANRTTSPSANR
jgi:ABC-type Mn2+/Zn2+ transport system permease subunit